MQKIMFNDRFLLTQAVLEGRKTQTRRLINPQPYYDENVGMVWKGYASGRGTSDYEEPQASYRNFVHHSKYKVGEIVAVAQSYKKLGYSGTELDRHPITLEPCGVLKDSKGWNNKMFVRAEACNHQVEITNVRLQRLQDITDEECLLEGIEKEERTDGEYNYIFFDARRELYIREKTPRDAYARLIDAISGKETWHSNPYVFVYDFELIK